MNYMEFLQSFQKILPVGSIMSNPGGGVSEIISYNTDMVTYRRGKSPIQVSIRALFDACVTFQGKRLRTTDLRTYAPRVFDSKQSGHSCNCTFLFMSLQKMGIVTGINGDGRVGSPFYVNLPAVFGSH